MNRHVCYRADLIMLKIDMSFVRGISKDKDTESIIQAMIRIAHSLRLTVVAEGVENEQQLTFLDKEGCAIMQGSYFSNPMPADAVIDYVDGFKVGTLKQANM